MESQRHSKALANYVANEGAFSSICREIEANVGSSIPQPVLVVGQEGAGKTSLLQRLVNTYPELPYVWIDGRTIFNTADIINQGKGKDILCIDNLDYYLRRCSYEEQFGLRRYLYNEGAPMMIATVSKLVPALTEYKAPFFEGLKKVHLLPIAIEELSTLFDAKAIARMASMYNLTSPTIKSIALITHIVENNQNPDRDIDSLLSFFSDNYKLIYQSIPITSQRILNVLGTSKIGLTVPEIRDKSQLTSGILTSYLKNLCILRLVSADKSIKRNTIYTIKDPLFRIWLKVTSLT